MGVCNCSMFCCTLLYVHSSIAIILMGKRELIALLNLSSWCLVMVERLFLVVPRGCLQFVIVVFPDHTHLLFLIFATKYFMTRVCTQSKKLFDDIMASLDLENMWAGKWCITFWVKMKKHGEISTFFRLKHHCGKEVRHFSVQCIQTKTT